MRRLVRWAGIYPVTVIAISMTLVASSFFEKKSSARVLEPDLALISEPRDPKSEKDPPVAVFVGAARTTFKRRAP